MDDDGFVSADEIDDDDLALEEKDSARGSNAPYEKSEYTQLNQLAFKVLKSLLCGSKKASYDNVPNDVLLENPDVGHLLLLLRYYAASGDEFSRSIRVPPRARGEDKPSFAQCVFAPGHFVY